MMNIKIKEGFLCLALTISVFGCSVSNTANINTPINSYASVKTPYTVKITDNKGASISFEINSKKIFSVKGGQGTPANPELVIKSYKVYLIKSSVGTGFYSGGDPLDPENIVGTPAIINVSNMSNPTIKFENVPASTSSFGSGDYYYIAVRAYDGLNATGNDLIKPNNGNGTAWGSNTQSIAGGRVAVSSGAGVQVNSVYGVSSSVTLPVNLYTTVLNNAAILDARIRFSDGSRISTYKINLCTDPTQPLTSKVGESFIVSKNNLTGYELTSFTNVPPGTYYAFVDGGFSSAEPTNNIIKINNGGTPYLNSDQDAQVAVSTNSVTINSSQQFTFSNSGTAFEIPVNLITTAVIQDLVNLSVFAGYGLSVPTTSNQQSNNIKLGNPSGIKSDSSGNLYIIDLYNNGFNNYIEKIDTDGNLKIIAGRAGGSVPTTNNQIATNVKWQNDLSGIAVDISGNIYISDSDSHYVEKIDTNGNLKIIAGKSGGSAPTTSNQVATNVALSYPTGLVTDSDNNLYVADYINNHVYKIDTNNNLKIIAGGGIAAPTTSEQNALNVALNNPRGLALDSDNNLYVVDSSNQVVEKIDTNGNLKIIAGNPSGTLPTINSQTATNVYLGAPSGITLDQNKNIYITDLNDNYVYKIDTSGNLKIIAGNSNGNPPSTSPQLSTSVRLNIPTDVTIDSSGNLYISVKGNESDLNYGYIEKVTP